MRFRRYLDQFQDWPPSGRHILAQYDADSIYVYQAYRPPIARFAIEHQRFGGDFSFGRMSWIKPNFLWMMYRSSWGTKEGQEYILAVRLRRTFFEEVLRQAVVSHFDSSRFATRDEWRLALESSAVRLQWDPDHDPLGRPVERRALQLGLRAAMLQQYAQQGLISIDDITPFVVEQRKHLSEGYVALRTPEERVFYPSDEGVARAVGLEPQATSQ